MLNGVSSFSPTGSPISTPSHSPLPRTPSASTPAHTKDGSSVLNNPYIIVDKPGQMIGMTSSSAGPTGTNLLLSGAGCSTEFQSNLWDALVKLLMGTGKGKYSKWSSFEDFYPVHLGILLSAFPFLCFLFDILFVCGFGFLMSDVKWDSRIAAGCKVTMETALVVQEEARRTSLKTCTFKRRWSKK